MRRFAIAFLVAAAAGSGTAHAATLGNWDPAEQKAVQGAGVLPALPGGFHGEQGLSAAQLNQALAAIARRTASHPVVVSASAPVTVASFHRALVKQLGLADVARNVQSEARRAGLAPPS
ncbi:MAG: hypothetical protein QOK04_22, partial [Solirubrobacteraceae bacterium]|nr:hypothetical protein [Solirubrobacteraceae bacterium]